MIWQIVCDQNENVQVRDVAKGGSDSEFELHDYDPNKKTSNMNLTVITNTEQEKEVWVKEINKLITELRDISKLLMSPI